MVDLKSFDWEEFNGKPRLNPGQTIYYDYNKCKMNKKTLGNELVIKLEMVSKMLEDITNQAYNAEIISSEEKLGIQNLSSNISVYSSLIRRNVINEKLEIKQEDAKIVTGYIVTSENLNEVYGIFVNPDKAKTLMMEQEKQGVIVHLQVRPCVAWNNGAVSLIDESLPAILYGADLE